MPTIRLVARRLQPELLARGMWLAGWDGDDGSFWRFPSASSRHVFVGVAGATTILFLYLIPISYGWEISAAGMLHRRWILERHIGVSPDS